MEGLGVPIGGKFQPITFSLIDSGSEHLPSTRENDKTVQNYLISYVICTSPLAGVGNDNDDKSVRWSEGE